MNKKIILLLASVFIVGAVAVVININTESPQPENTYSEPEKDLFTPSKKKLDKGKPVDLNNLF